VELARLTAVVRATTYSELKPMNNQDLTDQLKHLKLVLGRDVKKTFLLNRKAYVIRIQTLLFTEFGVGANNLEDCDDGYGGDGMRKRKASKRRGSGSGKLIKYLGFEWYANEEFEIDHLIDHMVADGGIVPGRTDVAASTELYLVLSKGFPPEIATWEVSSRLRAAARASGLWACLLKSSLLYFQDASGLPDRCVDEFGGQAAPEESDEEDEEEEAEGEEEEEGGGREGGEEEKEVPMDDA